MVDLLVHLRDEVSTVVDVATARPVATRGSFVNLLTGGDALGPLPAARIEGSIAGGSSEGDPFHFVLWCADDETRVILRFDTDTDVDQIASARIEAYALQ